MKKRYVLLYILLGCSFFSSSWAAEVDADLHWANRVELSTLVSGVVEKVNVAEGDYVNKGQILLYLSPVTFKAKIDGANAALANASAVLEEAKKEMDRSRELFDRTVMSVHELQLVENELTKANARHEAARTALTLARVNYNLSVQKAPYDGLVIKRYAQPGQTVVTRLQATPLMVLVNARKMLARVAVKQQQIESLTKGDQVTVKVGGKTYKAAINSVGLEVVTNNSSDTLFIIQAGFPVEKKDKLRAGMKARLVLP